MNLISVYKSGYKVGFFVVPPVNTPIRLYIDNPINITLDCIHCIHTPSRLVGY
jgi:hypothetical protein